jgi:hypothetical protein
LIAAAIVARTGVTVLRYCRNNGRVVRREIRISKPGDLVFIDECIVFAKEKSSGPPTVSDFESKAWAVLTEPEED